MQRFLLWVLRGFGQYLLILQILFQTDNVFAMSPLLGDGAQLLNPMIATAEPVNNVKTKTLHKIFV